MSYIKNLLKLPKVRVALALVAIGLGVVVSFLGPREPDPNIGLNTDSVPPTIGITQPIGSLTVNRGVTYHEVKITVTQVQEAGAFSDDRKHNGVYTVRVGVHVQPDDTVQSPIGIDYASLVRLFLADGEVISPKLISLLPVVLPHQGKDGYFDFPVSTSVALAALTLRIDDGSSISFSS